MSTNYYFRSKTPRLVYDEYHIAKRSAGWKPLFQANPPAESYALDDSPEELNISSSMDIKAIYDTGKFDIVDEYGKVLTWEEYCEEVVDWNANNPDAEKHSSVYGFEVYEDNWGYQFTEREFS